MRPEAIRDRRTPWCPPYLGKVEMSLTLKKFNDETMNKELNNYTELKDTNQNCFKILKRILVEDNVGIGETSFGRNVERDYAQETFDMFRLVLIAPLKLMTPNDCVEHVILRDNMALQKLKINSRKLRKIFETRGDECLIILNGNGEHAGWGKKKLFLRYQKNCRR